MQEWGYIYPDYLEHHGILGQKWGVRRYQYKDGTLTPAGRRRYRVDSEGNLVEMTRKERKAYAKAEAKEKAEEKRRNRLERENENKEKKKERLLKSRDIAQIYDNRDLFTTQELQDVYNRFNMERNISNLIPKEKEKSYSDIVDKLSKNIRSTAGLIESGTSLYNKYAELSNSLGGTDLPVIGKEKKSEQDKTIDKLKKQAELLKYRSQIRTFNKQLNS